MLSDYLRQPSFPPIVHQVLVSPGQPLDTATRVFMEPRFGHDFSQVRVHTWVKSTRRVGAGRNTRQGRQFCAYSYSCDAQGQLNLSLIKCYGTAQAVGIQSLAVNGEIL